MDINTQNSSGMMNGMPPTTNSEKKIGPIVGVLIIVLILIIAALYFFAQRLNVQTNTITDTASNINSTDNADIAPVVDNEVSIEIDLNAQLKDIESSF